MFNLISTLVKGANARAVDTATDHFAIDLIKQKIREAEQGLSQAKNTLASLIIRRRREKRTLKQLKARIEDLESRTKKALKDKNKKLAHQAAEAIAQLENEAVVRQNTLNRLNERTARMQLSIEKAYRRLVDLRQGATTAMAMDVERKAQKSLNRSIGNTDAFREAESLINRVVNQDDPFEQGDVLDEIDRGLSHENIKQQLAEAGYGTHGKSNAKDVLARLSKK